MSEPTTAPMSETLAALDDAYRERNAVVAALIRTNGWKASLVPAPDADGWWIVYAETPEGQVSWHVSPVDIRLFDGIPAEYVKWDGHTTDEKYERVARLAATPAPSEIDVDRLARALVLAVRSERAPIGGRGDGWPAYYERGLPATVLNVDLLARAIAREYEAAAIAAAYRGDQP